MKFLFDLGGIFFDWDPNHFYKKIFKNDDEREYFIKNICNDEWNIKQDAGRLIKDAENDLLNTDDGLFFADTGEECKYPAPAILK